MVCIVYVDDCLFFAKGEKAINTVLDDLEKAGYALTREQTVEAFLGIETTIDPDTNIVTMTQPGLIEKFIKHVGLEHCRPKATPENVTPLDSDPVGPERDDTWNYTAAIGMLLYVSSNTRPDIQVAVY